MSPFVPINTFEFQSVALLYRAFSDIPMLMMIPSFLAVDCRREISGPSIWMEEATIRLNRSWVSVGGRKALQIGKAEM